MICRQLVRAHISQHARLNYTTIFSAAKMSSVVKLKVKQGTIVGGERSLPNGNPYMCFQGIPYAVPPLGELRFEAPVPLKSFSTAELDCTKERDVSLHFDSLSNKNVGSENCLYLNVFAPKTKPGSSLPVMVFVHGGGFRFGSGNSDLYTPLYLMQEDVIVVTFNYRLGPLGFLSLPEGDIPGNAGLKDQRLALQWVKENIAQFNGNPDNITLFGESAGAASVHMHSLSENSKKLFHKAILQSGSAGMPWTMQYRPEFKATKFAELMGCTSKDPKEMIKFMKNVSGSGDFLDHIMPILSPDEIRRDLPLPFRPVVEKDTPEAVLTKEPRQLMEKSNISIPILMGYNSAEGLIMLVNAIKKLEEFDGDLGRLIPRDVNLAPEDPRSNDVAQMLREVYFKGQKVEKKTLDNLVNVLGDFHFIIDCQKDAEIHSRMQHNSPLYFYRFDYIGKLNMFKKILQFEKLKGASHVDDLFYVFQTIYTDEPWEDQDKKMVKMICKLWANFAKYGNPTPEKSDPFVDCVWEPVPKIKGDEKFNLNAFIIDKEQRMLSNPDGERMEFWRSVYKKYNQSSSSKL